MGDALHRITRLIGFFRSNATRGITHDPDFFILEFSWPA